jgi:hypothetical protein
MVKVNEALEGMWHEVALGETGSLVVQNIFENCVEEEKVREHALFETLADTNIHVSRITPPNLHCLAPSPSHYHTALKSSQMKKLIPAKATGYRRSSGKD